MYESCLNSGYPDGRNEKNVFKQTKSKVETNLMQLKTN